MSNALAVATVTASLAQQLSRFISDGGPTPVPGARVTFLPPSSESLQSGEPLVNAFLFRVVRNAELNNNDLPTRGPDGRPLDRPSAAINLDYLITFFGDDTRLEPQRLLGAVVAGLHAEPILSAGIIRDTIKVTPWLGGSDLATQAESVKFTPTVMTPEQMARFWSEFVHADYRLSVLYNASVVLLDTPARLRAALPVRRIGHRSVVDQAIVIAGVTNPEDPGLPVMVGGGRMAIKGPGLQSPDISLLIEGQPAAIAERRGTGRDAEIIVDLTPKSAPGLRYGPLSVQLIRNGPDGQTGGSPEITVTLVPGLVGDPVVDPTNRKLALTITPPATAGQAVALSLYAPASGPETSHRVDAVATDASGVLAFDVASVPPGTYLMWVEVEAGNDWFSSLLQVAAGGDRYVGPVVILTAGET